MAVKVTFFFQYGRYGWSESHYALLASDLTSAKAPALALAKIRANLMGGPVSTGPLNISPYLNYIRLSQDNVFRDSTLVTPTTLDIAALFLTGQIKSVALDAGDFANVSLRCRAEGGTLTRAIVYLAGCPENIFPGGEVVSFAAVAGFPQAFTQYQQELISGRWGFRAKNNVGAVQCQGLSAEVPAPNRLIVFVPSTFTATIGQKLQLRNFTMVSRAYKPLNGVYTVGNFVAGTGGSPNSITLNGTSGRDPALILSLGTVQSLSYIYQPYTAFYGLGASSRKRGVGFGSPVGRRRLAKEYAG